MPLKLPKYLLLRKMILNATTCKQAGKITGNNNQDLEETSKHINGNISNQVDTNVSPTKRPPNNNKIHHHFAEFATSLVCHVMFMEVIIWVSQNAHPYQQKIGSSWSTEYNNSSTT